MSRGHLPGAYVYGQTQGELIKGPGVRSLHSGRYCYDLDVPQCIRVLSEGGPPPLTPLQWLLRVPWRRDSGFVPPLFGGTPGSSRDGGKFLLALQAL